MVSTGSHGASKTARCFWLTFGVAIWLALPLVACGKSDESNITRPTTAGTGAAAGDDGEGGAGATTTTAGTTTGGTVAEEPCMKGDLDCDGNTPRECNNRGQWIPQEPCGGETKVCSKGTCFAYRLTNAGIDTFGVRPAEGDIVLKEQTLSAAPKVCGRIGDDKTDTCVTGGIR